MASEFQEGESVFFAFCNGKTALDSQNKPRMYKTRKQFEAKFPFLQNKCVKLIEYAPVVRCRDCKYFEVDAGLKYGVLCLQHGHRFSAPKPDDFCNYGERKEK